MDHKNSGNGSLVLETLWGVIHELWVCFGTLKCRLVRTSGELRMERAETTSAFVAHPNSSCDIMSKHCYLCIEELI